MIQIYTCITGSNTLGFVIRIDEVSYPSNSGGKPRRYRWNRFAYSRSAMLDKIRISWGQLVDHIGLHAATEVLERVRSMSDKLTSIQKLEYHVISGAIAPVWIYCN